jgi:hypothetical protein
MHHSAQESHSAKGQNVSVFFSFVSVELAPSTWGSKIRTWLYTLLLLHPLGVHRWEAECTHWCSTHLSSKMRTWMYTLLLFITHQNLACCEYVSLDPSSSQMKAAFSQMHAPAFNGIPFLCNNDDLQQTGQTTTIHCLNTGNTQGVSCWFGYLTSTHGNTCRFPTSLKSFQPTSKNVTTEPTGDNKKICEQT